MILTDKKGSKTEVPASAILSYCFLEAKKAYGQNHRLG